MSDPDALKYGRRQAIGRLLQQWIENPVPDPSVKTCPILPSTLKFKNLKKLKRLEIDTDLNAYIPVQIEHEFPELKIMGPTGGAWERVAIDEPNARRDLEYPNVHTWEGQIAPGLLIVEEIKRTKGVFMSEVCQAIYANYFPIDTLKYVYMLDVCNQDTRSFVINELYTESKGLDWPDNKPCDWKSGSPEFEALLGTKLGQTVARMVLGAFKRGTRHISRIRTYQTFEALQLQFAIEEIENTKDVVPTDAPIQSQARITRSVSRRQRDIESKKHRLDEEKETPKKLQKK